MRSRPVLVGLVTALLTSASLAAAAQAAPPTDDYIVVLNPGAKPAAVAKRHATKFDVDVEAVYRHALKGYAARVRGTELAALRRDRSVAYVEKDRRVSIAKARAKGRPGGAAAAAYGFASWGLDRIDQRNLPLDSIYDVTSNGSGVRVYVLDTGVQTSHSEFGSRASGGADLIDGSLPAQDCHGHGTHVAGTIAGFTYGVAKQASIVAVRVLDCGGSGTWSGVIAGLDFVAGTSGDDRVANLSIGGPASKAVDDAVANLVADGVTVVVAAGNEQRNACLGSPARAPQAITVGATTQTDDRASYSNFGSCVDLFAPGSSIKSAWYTSNSATATLSGTSMASPHVAGVAALLLGSQGSQTPGQVWDQIRTAASTGKVQGISKPRFSGTPNLLLYKD